MRANHSLAGCPAERGSGGALGETPKQLAGAMVPSHAVGCQYEFAKGLPVPCMSDHSEFSDALIEKRLQKKRKSRQNFKSVASEI